MPLLRPEPSPLVWREFKNNCEDVMTRTQQNIYLWKNYKSKFGGTAVLRWSRQYTLWVGFPLRHRLHQRGTCQKLLQYSRKCPTLQWACPGPWTGECMAFEGVVQLTMWMITYFLCCCSYDEQSYVPLYACSREVRWSEFFYPFMDIYPGESQQKTLAIALLFSIFIVLGVAVLCPLSIGHGASAWTK